MPAGNDKDNAVTELADKFGLGDARAEDLVEASRGRLSQRLKESQLLDRNDEATEEIDWDKAAKAVGVDPDSVLDVAIRGEALIVVFEDSSGRAQKRDCDASDVGVASKRGAGKAKQSSKRRRSSKKKTSSES